MIERCVSFTKNELLFIDSIDFYITEFAQGNVNGKVFYREDFVRYELNIGNEHDKFILQFCVRDNEEIEDGHTNFVYISNILVPITLSRQGIASGIITFMSQIANDTLDIPFYITCIVNDRWKNSLINHGGEEDEDGDVKIIYNKWKVLNAKYGIAYLNKKGDGYTDTEPYIYNCCCIEELKIAMMLAKQQGYQTLIPFLYNDKHDCDSALSWAYVEKNRIAITGYAEGNVIKYDRRDELQKKTLSLVSGQMLLVKEMTSPDAIGSIVYDTEMEFVEIRGDYIVLQDNKRTSSLTGSVAEYCFPVNEIGKTILPM